MNKLIKKLGREFESIYNEALKELNTAKDEDILQIQKYLDKQLSNKKYTKKQLEYLKQFGEEKEHKPRKEIYFDFNEAYKQKDKLYKGLGIPEEKIKIYHDIYRNFIYTDNVNDLERNDLIIIFDLNSESIEKRINKKINSMTYMVKNRIAKDEDISIEDIDMHPEIIEQIQADSKRVICDDPMSFVIKYPLSRISYINDEMIGIRMTTNFKYIIKVPLRDKVYLKLITAKERLLINNVT
jgi:hypothetical protein